MTFNSSVLPSGLTVLTYNIPTVKSVAISLIIKVGSRFETLDEAGISHFLEHMAFKGTSKRSARTIAEEFDSMGGNFNAYTGKEQTVYFAKVLNNNFSKALEIIADIIQNSQFNQEDIAKELQVILQEIAATYDNPDELVYEEFYRAAFADQSLGRSILGSKKTLEQFCKNDFLNFLNKYYVPNNMFLSIAGNIEHNFAVEVASKQFSLLPHIQNSHETVESATYTPSFKFIDRDLEQTTVILGFKSIAYTNIQEFYQAQILSLIFGGGISSRLFQQIRENLGLAYSVGAANSAYYDVGLFCIHASTSHDKVKFLIDNLVIEIKKIMKDISNIELDRAKEQIITSIYMAEEKSTYKSEEIGRNYAVLSRYYSTEELINRISATSVDEMIQIANKIFSTTPTLIILGQTNIDESDYQSLCSSLVS